MKIKVFSEKEIKKFLTNEKHVVISIQDPNYDFVKLPKQKSRFDKINLCFYDLDKDTESFPYSKFVFNKTQANNILKFVNKCKKKVNLICVNCVAGISRSAGVAAALSMILNDTDDYFFKHYLPNMLVYRTILNEYYGDSFSNFNKIKPSKNTNIKFIV